MVAEAADVVGGDVVDGAQHVVTVLHLQRGHIDQFSNLFISNKYRKSISIALDSTLVSTIEHHELST